MELNVARARYIVWVEYDVRGKRRRRRFGSDYEARRFYVMKEKLKKNPKIVRVDIDTR
jgi:hypothetical protein